MFDSIRHRIPITIPVGGGVSNFVLENNVPVSKIILPKLLFINTHLTVAISLTIIRRINLGSSSDPEDDGIINTTVVSQTISAGGTYTYTPDVNMHVDVDTPYVQHILSASHADGVETPILQILVSGVYDATTRSNLLNFSRAP